MPVDSAGNRADFIMDANSTINRMNLARLYEQYYNAAARDVVKQLCHNLQVNSNIAGLKEVLAKLEVTVPDIFNQSWDYLVNFYNIITPIMGGWFKNDAYKLSRSDHLAKIIKEGIYLYIPPENQPESMDILAQLEKSYAPTYSPVTYVGNSGNRVITKKPVRIGSVYIMLLEKTADDWTAVSSGKLSHFNVLSQVTNADKHSQPSRNQAIRALGESEVRIYVSYPGAAVTADILDRNNNPATHKQMCYSILGAEKPTDIINTVDRSLIPLGGAKPLQLVKHILTCSGTRFIYSKYKPNWQPPM